MSVRLSDDELSVLSTSLVALLDSRLCSRKKDGRFKIRCGDGKKRMVSEDFLTGLQDKLVTLAGHESISDDIESIRHNVRGS